MKQIYVSNDNLYKIDISPKYKIFCITFFCNNIRNNKKFFIKTEDVDVFIHKIDWRMMCLPYGFAEKLQKQLKEICEIKELWC